MAEYIVKQLIINKYRPMKIPNLLYDKDKGLRLRIVTNTGANEYNLNCKEYIFLINFYIFLII